MEDLELKYTDSSNRLKNDLDVFHSSNVFDRNTTYIIKNVRGDITKPITNYYEIAFSGYFIKDNLDLNKHSKTKDFKYIFKPVYYNLENEVDFYTLNFIFKDKLPTEFDDCKYFDNLKLLKSYVKNIKINK